MSNSHGKFVWYELMTPDPKAAETFYRSASRLGRAGRRYAGRVLHTAHHRRRCRSRD